MMFTIIQNMWGWLPVLVQTMFIGILVIFVIWFIVKLIIAIMQMIPFV